ncbi:MAG: uracil-DNA glycosylase [Candidatus Pacebacteria bacterium]|nr:uracil-DNA glycosylase [Candidatus Paceibacterota bacterium]
MKDTLIKIEEEVAACQACQLCKTRTNTVPGYGSSQADVMFIGEAPGKNEDLQGKPFIGAAGKVLDGLLASINLKREDVFIANVVKCRPPLNRDPLPEEVAACADFLQRQVTLIRPKIIILLGRHAMDRFIPGLKISLDHGKPKRKDGNVYFPIYHPAATIYNRALIEELQKDFKKIPKIIDMIEKEKDQLRG